MSLAGEAIGSVAIVGGISAAFVGTVLLVAACVHRRFCAKHPVALPVRRHSFRFTFTRPNPVTTSASMARACKVSFPLASTITDKISKGEAANAPDPV